MSNVITIVPATPTISERELFAEFLHTDLPLFDRLDGRLLGTETPVNMIRDYGEYGTLQDVVLHWPEEIGSDDEPLAEIEIRICDLHHALENMKLVHDLFVIFRSRRTIDSDDDQTRYSAPKAANKEVA